MKKRILSILLALCLALSLLPATAGAADIVESGSCGENLTWTLDTDGLLTISYSGTGTGTMSDYSSEDAPWYDSSNDIIDVRIGPGVTSIGNYAFLECSSLTGITIPDSVTSIGDFAFRECSSLTSVTIPDSVTSIGSDAFLGCISLTSITIPGSVTSIEPYAFRWCSGLTSITIADGVTSIGDWAFYGCSSLTSITIPDGVTSIGEYAFCDCSSLTSITISDSVTSIGQGTFAGCSSPTNVVFLGTPSTFDSLAFLNVSGATFHYPYKTTGWDTANSYGADEATWRPYTTTPTGVSTESEVASEASEAEVVVTSTTLPFDAEGGVNTDNYTVTTGGYTVTDAVLGGDSMSVTLTLAKAARAARAGEISIEVNSAAFVADYATITNGNFQITDSYTVSAALSGADTDYDPVPPPPAPPAPEEPQPTPPSTPTRPTTVSVDNELETGGPGEIVISGEGESDLQRILKPDEQVGWIDRVNLPQYAIDLYTVLCIGGDHDTLYDILIRDEYNTVSAAAGAGKEEADVESVLELTADLNLPYSSGGGLFQGDQLTGGFDVIDATAGDRAIQYGDLKEGDVVRTSAYNGIFVTSIRKDGNENFEEDKKAAATYASTAFQAFDRDHPEVFWLSGKSKLRLVTVTMQDGSRKYKETYIFFVLADADGFTVRDPLYPSEADVEAGIARRDAAVEKILSTVTAKAPHEQAAQINRWLTEHNEYNTSADLYSLPNWPHECLSALEGNIGTDGPVCDGYSRAFKVLCDRLEIPCVLVDGYARVSADSAGEFHMWNSARMSDGKWYGVDVTWNDPSVKNVSGAKSGHEREDFLLVGADTVVFGLKFSESHPPVNRAANGGVAFINGPTLSVTAFSPLAGAGVLPFTDVSPDSWYYSAVEYVYEHDLMTGETGAAFAPGGAMTRAMVWTVLGRMDGADVNGGTPWYSGAQSWAISAAVSDGSNPGGSVSREELVTMLWRTRGSPAAPADLSGFTDSGTVSGWASGAVQWAVSTGLLEGSNGKLNPGSRAARAEVAAILTRFCGGSKT